MPSGIRVAGKHYCLCSPSTLITKIKAESGHPHWPNVLMIPQIPCPNQLSPPWSTGKTNKQTNKTTDLKE